MDFMWGGAVIDEKETWLFREDFMCRCVGGDIRFFLMMLMMNLLEVSSGNF
jgi:hypothetical protein